MYFPFIRGEANMPFPQNLFCNTQLQNPDDFLSKFGTSLLLDLFFGLRVAVHEKCNVL